MTFAPFVPSRMTSKLLFVGHVTVTSPSPPSLKAEHLELSLKCEVLRTELDDAKTRLGASRRWFGLQPPGSKL